MKNLLAIQNKHRQQISALNKFAIITASDIDGNITYANDNFCNISGYTQAEIIGKNHRIFKSGIHSNGVYENMWETISSGKTWQGEICNRAKNGTLYWVNVTIVPFFNKDGVINEYLAIRSEITEKKNVQKLLVEKNRALNAAQKIAKLGHYTLDISNDIWESSKSLDEIFGIDDTYKKDTAGWLNLIHDDHRKTIELYLAKHVLKEKKSFDKIYKISCIKTKAIKWVHGYGKLEFDKENNPIKMLGVIQDITSSVEIENNKFKEIIAAEEIERQRISQEIHDGLGQKIAAANMYINALEEIANEKFSKEEFLHFSLLKKLISEATVESRVISHNIMPASLNSYGLETSIKEILDNYKLIQKNTQFHLESVLETKRFSKQIEITVFRITQEAISNSVKYANASNVSVILSSGSNKLHVTIKDDGDGFDFNQIKKKKEKGLGLINFQNRTKLINGTLNIDSKPNKGTVITVIINLIN